MHFQNPVTKNKRIRRAQSRGNKVALYTSGGRTYDSSLNAYFQAGAFQAGSSRR